MHLWSLICFLPASPTADEISYSKHCFSAQTSEKTFNDVEITTGLAQLPLGWGTIQFFYPLKYPQWSGSDY